MYEAATGQTCGMPGFPDCVCAAGGARVAAEAALGDADDAAWL
jgi:hypothetical protein